MTQVTFVVLGIFVVQTLLPAALRYLHPSSGLRGRLKMALGPRDEQPPLSPLAGRAQRALRNMQEALPVFLTLALLLISRDVATGLAVHGAWLFAGARLVYVPAYLSGIPGLRSLVWMLSWVGLAMMLAVLWH